MRASPIRLSDMEKWQVAEYCVANRVIVEDATKKSGYKYRIHQVDAVKEISENLFKVNSGHLKGCIEYYKLHHEHFKKPIILPQEVIVVKEIKAPQGDLFKEKIDKLEEELKLTKELLEQSEVERKKLTIDKFNLREKLERVKKFIGELK